MKMLLFALLFTLSLTVQAGHLNWTYTAGTVPPTTWVTLCGPSTGNYTMRTVTPVLNPPQLTLDIGSMGLAPGTWYCVMAAASSITNTQSVNSNEASFTVGPAPAPITNLTVVP